MDIDVGTLIAGKYELVRLIGKGAMGEVWLATHASLGEKFAIKLVEPTDDIEAETAAGRFQLEAQIAAKLSRKTRHIVSVSDHGEENGLAYLVMELLDGESLETKVKRSGALQLPEVVAISMQVARALQLAHDEGIFHRDLKPANVFLTRDEDGRLIVKLLDFGIARAKKPFKTRSPFATSKDMVLGTPSYMSPEQARGLDSLDYRCDLWGLAVVAYEALTRTIPFEGETVEDIFLSICTFKVVPARVRRPELPPEVEEFFARAFAPNIEDRFRTAAELSEALERLVPLDDLEHELGGPIGLVSPRSVRIATPVTIPDAHRRPGSKPTLLGPISDSHKIRPGSHPELARPPSNPDFLPPPPSGPGYGHGGFGRQGSNPDFHQQSYFEQGIDPMPMSVGEGSDGASKKRRGGGWIIAAAGLLLFAAIAILALVAFRGTSKGNAAAASMPPAASSSVGPAAMSSQAIDNGQPTIEIVEVPSQGTQGTPAPPFRPRPKPTFNVKPTVPTAPAPASASTPTPASTPTSPNKSGVF